MENKEIKEIQEDKIDMKDKTKIENKDNTIEDKGENIIMQKSIHKIRNWIIFYVLFFAIIIGLGIYSTKQKDNKYDYEEKTVTIEDVNPSISSFDNLEESIDGNTLVLKGDDTIYKANANAFLKLIKDYKDKMKSSDFLKLVIQNEDYLLFNKELSACTYYKDGKDYNLSLHFEDDVYEVLALGQKNPFLYLENVEYVNEEGFLVN